MYYTIKDNKIDMCADFKFSDNCIYSTENIVRGFDGTLRFEKDTQTVDYITSKNTFENAQQTLNLIEQKISRLEELRKDFEQDRLGLVIPNIESKKSEYVNLLQEVRILQGKTPRNIKNISTN